jgi:hypothetical protein
LAENATDQDDFEIYSAQFSIIARGHKTHEFSGICKTQNLVAEPA